VKLIEKTYYQALLPFVQKVGGNDVATKNGVLYRGIYQEKEFSCDLSPFPGFSQTSLEECTRAFEDVFQGNRNELPKNHHNPHIDFACYQILDQVRHSPTTIEPYINLVTTLSSLKQVINSANENSCIKVKLGPSEEEQSFFLEAIKEINKELSFRIDGNCRWSVKTLENFWQKFKSFKNEGLIDYFEEPLEDFQSYQKLSQDIPYAHEEYLSDYLKHPNRACAIVIKPSQLGTWSWTQVLNNYGLRVIISSAYETWPGLIALKRLCLMSPNEFHGLGAYINNEEIKPIKTIKF